MSEAYLQIVHWSGKLEKMGYRFEEKYGNLFKSPLVWQVTCSSSVANFSKSNLKIHF